MKKTILFLHMLLVLLSATPATAQSFPGTAANPTWKVGVWNFWQGNCEAYHWKYGNTVPVCGQQYIEALECDHNNSNCQVKGYVRTSLSKVFVRKTTSCSETERLMYDFGLPAGASYQMAYNLGVYDSTRAQVTATTTQNYQGVNRLTQSLTYTVDPPANNYNDNMLTIEGIGCDIHPFYPLVCFGDFCETNLQLVEYKENNTVLYSKTPVFPLACNGWVGIQDHKKEILTVFPNPVTSVITVKSGISSGSIQLCDNLGRVLVSVQMTESTKELDVSGLSSGVYYLELFNEQHVKLLTQKILKN